MATKKKTRAKKKQSSRQRKPSPETIRTIERNRNLVVLQASPNIGGVLGNVSAGQTAFIVTMGRMAAGERAKHRKPGSTWLAFLARDQIHVDGLTLWIGFSTSVPKKIIAGVQADLEKLGARTSMEMANAGKHGFLPSICVSDDGCEMLWPADAESVKATDFETLFVAAEPTRVSLRRFVFA